MQQSWAWIANAFGQADKLAVAQAVADTAPALAPWTHHWLQRQPLLHLRGYGERGSCKGTPVSGHSFTMVQATPLAALLVSWSPRTPLQKRPRTKMTPWPQPPYKPRCCISRLHWRRGA